MKGAPYFNRLGWNELRRVLAFALALAPLFTLNLQAGGWVEATLVNPNGGKIYRDATDQSEHLGTYPKGISMKVYDPPRKGFYSIYLKKAWKGAQYIWISEQDISLKSGPRSPQRKPQNTSTNDATQNRESKNDVKAKNWSIEPMLGYSTSQFQQTGLNTTYSMTAVTGQLNLRYQFPESPLEMAADANYTLSSLSSSLPGITARYLRINGKGGLGFDMGPLRIDILAGLCWDSISVSNDGFGYKPFILTGVYPSATLNLGKKFALLAQARYFPDFNNQMASLELVWSLGILFRTSINHRITLLYSNSQLAYGKLATAGVYLQANEFSLGYSF
jgi:hypothetical protein